MRFLYSVAYSSLWLESMLTSIQPSVQPAPADPVEAIVDGIPASYRVGTLAYTVRGLVQVFMWMLWGDLCLNVMESVIPRLVPLQIQHAGGSNALIGVLTVTIFSLMNWVMNPIISTWSDRHRSTLGRRIPFILYASPFLALALVAIGLSGDIARLVENHLPALSSFIASISGHLLPGVGPLGRVSRVTLGVLTVALIAYKFFDLFPQTVYYYLFIDVIPQQVMGRFVCSFRVIAALGGVLFNLVVLAYFGQYIRSIFIGCAMLYLMAFLLISLFVKEGDYPPPPPRSNKRRHESLALWFKESFGIVFYWKSFITSALTMWIWVPFNTFIIIYAEESLKIKTEEFGHLIGLVMLAQLPAYLFLGPVIDKVHPTRVAPVGFGLMFIAGVCGFFFVHGHISFVLATGGIFVCAAVLQGMISTLQPRVLPKSRYGQFCAANAMVRESGMIFLAWLCGRMLDVWGVQYLYLWAAGLSVLGMVASIVLLRAWLRLGGDANFVPPPIPGDPDIPLPI